MSADFISKNLKKGLIALLLLLGVSFVLGLYFETHLQDLINYLVKQYHPGYLFFFIYLNDLIISPIPPDAFLLLLAKAKSYPHRDLLVLAMGVSSMFAGISAWWLARFFIKADWLGLRFQKYMSDNKAQLEKFANWMVALGALTPLPYSMTCWAAGVIKMRSKAFILLSSLRVLRFYVYFKLLQFIDFFFHSS